MKPKYYLPIALASLVLATNVTAQDEYREHSVTFSCTLSTEAPEQFKENENGYKASRKIATEKLSNKEILEALADEGVISNIKGWSIKILTLGNGNIEGVFLTKKDTTPIDITEFFEFDIYFALEAYTEQSKEKNGDETYESTSRIYGTGSLNVYIGDFSTDTLCIVKISGEDHYEEDDGDVVEDVSVTEDASFEKIVGEAYDGDEAFGVIEGSVRAGDGKETDLELYLEVDSVTELTTELQS